jgi:hypothetical protein
MPKLQCEAPRPYRRGFPGTQWRAGCEQMKYYYIVPLYPALTAGACGAPTGQIKFKIQISKIRSLINNPPLFYDLFNMIHTEMIWQIEIVGNIEY